MANDNEVKIKVVYENDKKSLAQSAVESAKYLEEHAPEIALAKIVRSANSARQAVTEAGNPAYKKSAINKRKTAYNKMVKSYQKNAGLLRDKLSVEQAYISSFDNKIKDKFNGILNNTQRNKVLKNIRYSSLGNKNEITNNGKSTNTNWSNYIKRESEIKGRASSQPYKSPGTILAEKLSNQRDLELSKRMQINLSDARRKVKMNAMQAKKDERQAKRDAIREERAKERREKKRWNDATKGARNISHALGRITTYKVIRGLISVITKGFSEGTKNLYEWSKLTNGSFKSAMDKIASSFDFIQNSAGALAGTFLEVFQPFITSSADKLAEIVESASRLVAIIGNSDFYYKANKQAKEFIKTQRQIMGFDVINKLGNDDTDYASLFEKAELDYNNLSKLEQVVSNLSLKFNGLTADWGNVGKIGALITGALIAKVATDGFKGLFIDGGKIGESLSFTMSSIGLILTFSGIVNMIDSQGDIDSSQFWDALSKLALGGGLLGMKLLKFVTPSLSVAGVTATAVIGLALLFKLQSIALMDDESKAQLESKTQSILNDSNLSADAKLGLSMDAMVQQAYSNLGAFNYSNPVSSLNEGLTVTSVGASATDVVIGSNSASSVLNNSIATTLANRDSNITGAIAMATGQIVSSVNGKNLTLSTTQLGGATNGYNNSLSRRFGN